MAAGSSGAPRHRGLDTLASRRSPPDQLQCRGPVHTIALSHLMTGRYAIRSGNGTVPLGEGVYGLVQWEVTMAEMLVRCRVCHRHVREVASRQNGGTLPDGPGLRRVVRRAQYSTDEAVLLVLGQDSSRAALSESFVMEGKKGSEPRARSVPTASIIGP